MAIMDASSDASQLAESHQRRLHSSSAAAVAFEAAEVQQRRRVVVCRRHLRLLRSQHSRLVPGNSVQQVPRSSRRRTRRLT